MNATVDMMKGQRNPDDADAVTPAEPATARALWPTFMRRTLEDEALRAIGREARRTRQAAPTAAE